MLLALFATALTAAVTPVLLVVLRRSRVIDVPNERSSHDRPTPRGGGAALAIGALAAAALSPALSGNARVGVFVAAIAFGTIGLIEDLVGVPPLVRLGCQVVAALAAAPWLLSPLSNEIGWPTAPVLVAITALWLVSYVNAFNFMDGIDGISVAQALVVGIAWYAIGKHEHVLPLAAGGAILVGATAGFAPFNIWRARVFLGDVGSYFLGAWIAALAVVGLRAGIPVEAMLAPLAVYLADTGSTLVWRLARHECMYAPHRDHAYQRLVKLGWSHLRTTLFVSACLITCSGLGAISLSGDTALRAAADIAILAVLGVYVAGPAWLARLRGLAVMAPSPS